MGVVDAVGVVSWRIVTKTAGIFAGVIRLGTVILLEKCNIGLPVSRFRGRITESTI